MGVICLAVVDYSHNTITITTSAFSVPLAPVTVSHNRRFINLFLSSLLESKIHVYYLLNLL